MTPRALHSNPFPSDHLGVSEIAGEGRDDGGGMEVAGGRGGGEGRRRRGGGVKGKKKNGRRRGNGWLMECDKKNRDVCFEIDR